jgi:hypothetical protein
MLPLYTLTLTLSLWLALGARVRAEDVPAEGSRTKTPESPAICERNLRIARWNRVKDWGQSVAAAAAADTYTHGPITRCSLSGF